MDESVEEHTEGASKYEHTWKAEYDGSTYIRSAKQFGSGSDELDGAKVNIKMLYPQYGKAGLIFGLNTTEGAEDIDGNKTKTYNYFVVAVGENANKTDGTLEYYIDYCTGMSSLSGGNSADSTITTGEQKEVVPLTDLVTSHKANEAATFDIEVSYADAEGSDSKADGTYTVKIYFNNTAVATAEIDCTEFCMDGTTAKYAAQGTIASYGMLSGKHSSKKVDTTWLVDKATVPSTLAADAE